MRRLDREVKDFADIARIMEKCGVCYGFNAYLKKS